MIVLYTRQIMYRVFESGLQRPSPVHVHAFEPATRDLSKYEFSPHCYSICDALGDVEAAFVILHALLSKECNHRCGSRDLAMDLIYSKCGLYFSNAAVDSKLNFILMYGI
jgi:hypothetical protein